MKNGIEQYNSYKYLKVKNSNKQDLNNENFRKMYSRTLFANKLSQLSQKEKSQSTNSFLHIRTLSNNDINNNNHKNKLLNIIPFMNIKNILKGKEIPLLYSKPSSKNKKKKNDNNNFSLLSSGRRLLTYSMKKLSRSKKYYPQSFSKINFFEDYEKDFFPDVNFSNLEYKESEIFGKEHIYEKLIKDKILYFQKEKNENNTIKLEKDLYYGKYKKEIRLTLKSINISFEEMNLSKKLQNQNLKVDIPFALIPLFYYKGIGSFIKILSQIIKAEKNFEEVYFDENAVQSALNNIKDFKVKDFKMFGKRKSDKKIVIFDNDSKVGNTDKPIILKSPGLTKNKNFLKFNIFVFYWVTLEKTYSVSVTLPIMTLNILGEKIVMNQFIEYELLFFLYKRNFLNWEFFIIKYLSSYSKFRNIIRKLGQDTTVYNEEFFLKEPRIRYNSFSDEVLLNVYTDQFCRNQVLELKSFYILVNFIDTNYSYEKIYEIHFNFLQYLKLYEISKYSNKILFLIKFLEINNEIHSLNFNFKEYDEFDIKNWMDNIRKFSSKSLKNIFDEKLTGEFDICSKKIKIAFKKPKWSLLRIENDKERIKNIEIGKDLELEFVQCMYHEISDNWKKLVNECLKRLNEPVPVLPMLSTKKRLKRMGTKAFNTTFRSKAYRLSKVSP